MKRYLTIWALAAATILLAALPCNEIQRALAADAQAGTELILAPEENGDTYLDLSLPTLGAVFGSRVYIYDTRGESSCVDVLADGTFERTIPDAPGGARKLLAGDLGVFLLAGNRVHRYDGQAWIVLDTISSQLGESDEISLNDINYLNGELYVLYSYQSNNAMYELIKKFTFDESGLPVLNPTTFFGEISINEENPLFNGFVLLSNDAVADKIYVLSNRKASIFNENKTTPYTELKKSYTHMSTDNQYLYLSSTVGLEAYDLVTRQFASAMEPLESPQYRKGCVNEFTATFAGDGEVFVLDRESRALTSFAVSGQEFVQGRRAVYSASVEGYAGPKGIAATQGALFVADSGNSRIKRLKQTDEGMQETALAVPQRPEAVCADELDNLWYLSKGMLYWVRSFSADNLYSKTLEGITRIAPDERGGLYVLNPEGIWHYENYTAAPSLLEQISESGLLDLEYHDKTQTLYLLTARSIVLYSCRENQYSKYSTIPLPAGIAPDRFTVDYYGNVYLFDGSKIYVCSSGDNRFTAYAVTLTRNQRAGTVDDFAVDRVDGSLLFVSESMHCVAVAPVETLRAKVLTDAPECATDVNIYAGSAQSVLKYVTVSSFSAVFYPDGEAAAALEAGTRVMVLDEQGDYSYVFCGDRGGWIYNRYTQPAQTSGSPFPGKDMRVLRTNTAYLILPSLRETEQDSPLFRAGVLDKGDKVSITADLGEIDGLRWVQIQIRDQFYYLPVTAVGEYRDESVYLYELLTLSSAQDEISLYAQASTDSQVVLVLPNRSKVKLLEKLDGWYRVLAETADGTSVECYVQAGYVVPDGLTAAQKTGLILVVVVVVAGIVFLIVKRRFKKI